MTSPYEAILKSLESVPWSKAAEVTPIRPIPRDHIEFFPGHVGYVGANFPVGGIMAVGNNFSNLVNWRKYETGADHESDTKTWSRLRLMIAASGEPIENWWFTNYCLGVIDGPSESYNFPRRTIKLLEFQRVFAECVAAMRPRLIVALGRPVADSLKADYSRERIEATTVGGHATRLLATVHPSAWTWRGKEFGDREFVMEGERIGLAARG